MQKWDKNGGGKFAGTKMGAKKGRHHGRFAKHHGAMNKQWAKNGGGKFGNTAKSAKAMKAGAHRKGAHRGGRRASGGMS